jgi:hypothetical protein
LNKSLITAEAAVRIASKKYGGAAANADGSSSEGCFRYLFTFLYLFVIYLFICFIYFPLFGCYLFFIVVFLNFCFFFIFFFLFTI